MAMKRDTKRLVVGGSIGGLALLLGYGIFRSTPSFAGHGEEHEHHERRKKHEHHEKHKKKHRGENGRGEYGRKREHHRREEHERDD